MRVKNTLSNEDTPFVIKTTELTKTFGTQVAVDDLHLEVKRGDVFGFLGPNGSGKTTTIRMLLGLLRPTAGQIHLFGINNATQLPRTLLRLGALIEMPVFYPYLSGLDNMRVLAARSGMKLGKANNHRIDTVFDLIDLRHRANDLYRTYSLGMKQRLGIGAALLTDPELILLDEPTNGLDPAGVHEIRQLILRLAAQGKTIFLSSHLLYEVQQVCNRVAILHKGHLLKQGNVQELLSSERVIVHMRTLEETEQAFTLFQEVHAHGILGVRDVSRGIDTQQNRIIFVDAPTIRSAEIAALLAQQHLFPAELYHYQATLEAFFLDATTSSREDAVVTRKP
jgi:ABC-2 type transport system ATP-binding protein